MLLLGPVDTPRIAIAKKYNPPLAQEVMCLCAFSMPDTSENEDRRFYIARVRRPCRIIRP